jgi:hypothetical protein
VVTGETSAVTALVMVVVVAGAHVRVRNLPECFLGAMGEAGAEALRLRGGLSVVADWAGRLADMTADGAAGAAGAGA